MDSYPFVIGNKVVKIAATGIRNAINRVTTKHPNKFINITHAKNMDLISAKVEAAKHSRTEKKKIYIIVDDDGECELNHAPLKGVYACYSNGSEIALENDAEVATITPRPNKSKKRLSEIIMEDAEKIESKQKKKLPAQSEKALKLISKQNTKETVMATTKPANKAAKKVAAKKESKVKDTRVGKATTLLLSAEQWKRVDALITKDGGSIREMVAEALITKFKL